MPSKMRIILVRGLIYYIGGLNKFIGGSKIMLACKYMYIYILIKIHKTEKNQ